jgi:TolB-like protein/Tfp pilus assembly protein PilF
VAILAADVVGYSRLMGKDEAGTLGALKALRKELVAPEIAKHKGRIVNEFGSVVDAVECAVAIQVGIVKRNEGTTSERKILLRIGVNLGDIIVDGRDIYGDGVNVAARLEELAEPGSICISNTVHEHIAGKLDHAFTDAGEQTVKNIARSVRVWRWSEAASCPATTTNSAASLPLPDKPSIAVLPFTNMSGDPEQEYFSDGITEDIITALSRFRSLTVMARTSSFTFKGKSATAQEVGRRLGVQYVVEGSVRKAGQRIRVTAQLIEAATGSHVWAERYDRDIEDIFAVQDDVTQMITTALAERMEHVHVEGAKRKPPRDLAAYDYLLRGRELLYRWSREPNQEAQRLLQSAVELDPDYGRAHAYLSLTYYSAWLHGWARRPDACFARFFELAERSVVLDEEETITHTALALAQLFRRRHDEARHHMAKALSLNPNDPETIMTTGYIAMYDDRVEEAIACIEQAMKINPFARYGLVHGIALFSGRRYEDSIAAFKTVRAKVPTVQAMLAACYANLGAEEECRTAADNLVAYARAEIEPAGAPTPASWTEFFDARLPYRTQADRDHLCDSLQQAGLP